MDDNQPEEIDRSKASEDIEQQQQRSSKATETQRINRDAAKQQRHSESTAKNPSERWANKAELGQERTTRSEWRSRERCSAL